MLIRFLFTGVLCGILTACSPNTPQSPPPSSSQTISASLASLKGLDVRKDKIGGDFTLTDAQGKPFALSSLKGKVVALIFGFTNCPDVCPTELLAYREAMTQLGDLSHQVAVVFVSVDPERDTPDLIGRYVKQFHPHFIGLTDTQQGNAITAIQQQYRIVSAKTEIQSPTIYNIDHTSGSYLLDKNGQVAVFEPYGVDSTQLAQDMRQLLAQ